MEMMLGAVVIRANGRDSPGVRHFIVASVSFMRLIDFGDRFIQLRAPALVRRRDQLAIELHAREPQRLERVHLLRIADDLAVVLARALALQLFHALLNAPFRVDQTLTCVTHESPSSENEYLHIIR